MAKRGGGPTATERRMRALLQEAEASGLTLSAFARRRRIRPGRLHWWRSELRRRDLRSGDEAAEMLIPVEVVPPPAADRAAREELVIDLRSGHRLRVPAGFDPESLRLVVEILEPSC